MVWDGVASAAGSDARSRDAGDAVRIVEERRRRRWLRAAATPWGGWPFARDEPLTKNQRDSMVRLGAKCKRPDATPEFIFQHPAR